MENCLGIRVYVVDDHEVVRRGISSLVSAAASMEVVGQTGSAQTALPAILRLKPDVVVLDHHLPDGNGVDLCREICAADPDIKVLILTGHDDSEVISTAILAGASGYVLKSIDGDSLVSGIRLVAGGHSLIDPSVASRMLEEMELQKRSLDVISDLTPQQRTVLLLIGEGMTNRQIAERLFLAEKTVKNHITALLAKLGLEHRTQAALVAARLTAGVSSTSLSSSRSPAARRA
jgi:DNA-binding NarL/FixJ family response regulator